MYVCIVLSSASVHVHVHVFSMCTIFFFLQGCSFGYFVGGWGKPPVDEVGRPLYGDVFGLDQQENGE